MDSILTSIKKLLGIAEDYTHFDDDIIIHINSAFSSLNQLGVGPSYGFHIEDDSLGESVIAEVLQKGYKKGDKIIRYAMVKVAN